MFCPACGTQTSDDAKFCKKCGAPIGDPPPGYVPAKPKRKFRWGLFFLSLAGALLLAISLSVYMTARASAAEAEMRRALVVPLDSALAIHKSSGALATVDSIAAHVAEMNSDDLSGYLDESKGASPLRATACISLFMTTDSLYGFGNRCNYPVEIAFCASEARIGSPGWTFQCEGSQSGRLTLGAEGLVAVLDLTGAKRVWIAACNATEAGPTRMWTQSETIRFDCMRRTRLPAEPVGTGAASVGSSPNSIERLAECRALADGRQLVGADRAALIDACMQEASVEGSAFNETEKSKE